MEEAKKNVSKQMFLAEMIGDPVFIMCIRYAYRGTVVSVSSDGIILKDATVVFGSGALSNKKASNEEALPGINFIALDAIEGIFPYLPFIFNNR